MSRGMRRWIAPALAVLLSTTVHNARAEEGDRTVRSTDVLDLMTARNPSLKAALAAEARAAASVQSAEGLYPFVFNADTGYTHDSNPLGASLYRRTDQISIGAGISKSLSIGTAVDFHLDGQWYREENPAPDTLDVGGVPSYGLGARLTLTQPLLRGFGNRVGLAALRQARRERTAAEKSTDNRASALAKDALSAYWNLWLAGKTVEINMKSRDTAAAQLQETAERVALGDAAAVDKLSYQTRLASLEETVLASKAAVRQLQVSLAAMIGVIDETSQPAPDMSERPEAVSEPENRPLGVLVKQALTESPAIQESFAAVASAEEKLSTAGESLRQKLDLTGWIEARTLGQDDVSPVVTDFGKGGAYSGYVGLTYELPLDNRRKRAERAQAKIDVEIATQNLKSTEYTVRSDVAAAYDDLNTAKQRLSMAEETLALAEAQADAERERYRLGAAIFTTVRDAEETVRGAELRTAQAEVDIVLAQITLDHLTGTLLKTLAVR